MLDYVRNVQQHAHGNEKYAGEYLSHGDQVRHRLVTELASGDDQAGQERPERERDARQRQAPGDPEASEKDGQNEELPLPRLGHERKQVRDDAAGCKQHAREDGETDDGRDCDFLCGTLLSRQNGHRQEHGDHAQVLEDENADGQTAVRRVQFSPRRQAAQNDGGAGYGDDAAQKHRRPRFESVPDGQGRGACDRGRHLNAPAQKDGFPNASQVAEREFETDPEQEEDDANLGQHLDLMGVVHQAQCGGSDKGAREDEPRDRRNAHAAQHRSDHDRRPEYDYQVPEILDFRQALLPPQRGGVGRMSRASLSHPQRTRSAKP